MNQSVQQSRATGVSRKFWIVLAVAVLLGALARFWNLSHRELWLDEACTFYYVHNLTDWPAEGPSFRLEVTSIPYVAALWGWTRAAGESEFGLRSFSAMAGVAGIAAIGVIGRTLGGPRAGAYSALVLAVHPLHVYYGREARVYALWFLLISLVLLVLYRAVARGTLKSWALYIALLLLTVTCHYYTLFWIPATVAAIVIAPDRRRALRQWLAAHGVVGLALIPLFYMLIQPVLGRGSQDWLAEVWNGYPAGLAVAKSLWANVPSGGYPADYMAPLAWAGWTVSRWFNGGAAVPLLLAWLPAMVCLLLMVWIFFVRPGESQDQSDRCRTSRLVLMASMFSLGLLFLLVAWLYSSLRSPAYVVARYDLAVLPPLVLALSLLIDGARRRRAWIGRTALVVMVICGTATTLGLIAQPSSNDTAARVTAIKRRVSPDDLIISMGGYKWFIVYELWRQNFEPDIASYPPQHDQQVGWNNAPQELLRPDELAQSAIDLVDDIAARIDRGEQVWLIVPGDAKPARIEVDRFLFEALATRGLRVELIDEHAGLARIDRSR